MACKPLMKSMKDTITYRLFVPTDPERTHISPGSAIVGEPNDNGFHVHYERGGASNVQTFEEKILHAADRRRCNYPTAATAWMPNSLLKDVGSVRYDEMLKIWVIDTIDDLDALTAWAPGEHIIGGTKKAREDAASRAFSRLSNLGQRMVINDTQSGSDFVETILSALRHEASKA